MENNIRKLRKERGLTLKKLSELTGLAPSLISRYENGDRHPKIENWQKLADYFGVSVEHLQGKTFINKRPDKEKMTAMIYYYKIDIKDNIFLTEHNVDEHSVFLSEFEVDFLRKVLENELLDSLLKRLDYLRGALEAEDGIELKSYYVLVQALVTQGFQTFFKIAEPKYYVHVLPGTRGGYLNANEEVPNGFYFDTKKQWGGSQTEFTKEEIEELKKYSKLKGINFDECLEEVSEDED